MLVIEISLGVVSIPPIFCYLKDIDYRGKISMLCEFLSVDPAIAPDLARDAFASCCVPPALPVSGHTHPTAAAYRSAATLCSKNIAASCGTDLYFIQMSKSDQRKGYKGSRQTWWAKDTNVENRRDVKKDDDMLAIVDTDYYMDMPYILGGKPRPVLLYTAVPSEAAAHDQESFTSFNDKGQLDTVVAGGGRYTHYLWDYATDCLIVRKRFCFITYRMTTYAVERKQISAHRQLILLAPIKVYNGIFSAWLAGMLIEGKTLDRFDPLVTARDGTKFIRFNVHKNTGTFVTTARPGEALCATISLADDNAVAAVARLGTTNLMIPTTASWMPSVPSTDPNVTRLQKRMATITTEYHRLAIPRKVPTVFPVVEAVRTYQFNPSNYDQEARSKVQAFMNPLVHGAFAGANTSDNARQAIKGRIEALKKKEPPYSPIIDKFMEEFVNLVVRGAELHPCDYESIAERQTSAPQRVSLRKAVTTGIVWRRIVKSFIKGEAYADVKDGRIITTFDDLQKLMLAMFALPAAAHMKQFAWYGPGKKPLEIANRMVEICADADFMNISDYHRMDGTITATLRELDRRVLLRMFPAYRAELNELLKATANNTGFLDEHKYEQGTAQGSGCSLTSFIQTLRAAFCSYCAYRHGKNQYGYMFEPMRAFEALGIHNGDDGADPGLSVSDHQWAAAKLGLVLEASTVQRGFPGVNFLARYYSSEVWFGCPDSMCDIRRQLAKFHTTLRLPHNVTPEQKCVEKAMAYVATDCNTPILGEFCKQMLVLSSFRPQTPLGIGYWWGRFASSDQYPNNNVAGWMDVELTRMFPEFDRALFNQWLASAQTVQEMLSPPLCAEPVPARPSVPAVVDGAIVEPAAPAAITPPPAPTPTVPTSSARLRNTERRNSTPNARGRGRGRGRGPGRSSTSQQQQQPVVATANATRRPPPRGPQYRRVNP